MIFTKDILIQAERLAKVYNGKTPVAAVCDVSFSLRRESVGDRRLGWRPESGQLL